MPKKNQYTSKSALLLSPAHSYTAKTLSASNMTASSSAAAEDAGVCVVCEDECTCGAAKSTSISSKKFTLSSNARHGDSFAVALSVQSSPIGLPLKKKRGRPSKADILAREAAARAAGGDNYVPPPQRPKSKPKPKPKASSSTSAAARKPSAARARVRPLTSARPALGAALPRSFQPKKRRIIQSDDDDDELSDPSLSHFPTFVPASVLGSELNSSGSSSSSLSSEDELDSSVEAEEEQLIRDETLAMRKLRVKRELLGNDNPPEGGRRWDQLNWNKRERHSSVELDGMDDLNSDSDSDDEASSGDDDDPEEDEEPDLDGYNGPMHDWSEEEEDYDADVFFANLSDSSFGSDSSDSEHQPAPHPSTELIAEDDDALPDADHTQQMPLIITEDSDGHLIFAHGMKPGEGALNRHFDDAARAIPENAVDTDEADVEDTDDDEAELSDEDADNSETEDDGNTTVEEDIPLQPFTPPERIGLPLPIPPVQPPNPAPSVSALPPVVVPPKPTSKPSSTKVVPTLKLTAKALGAAVSKPLEKTPSSSALRASTPTPRPSSTVTNPTSNISDNGIPTIALGSFTIVGEMDIANVAVIDGSRQGFTPSPFSYVRKSKTPSSRGRKRRASEQPSLFSRLAKRARQSSLPGSTRSDSHSLTRRRLSDVSDELHIQSSPELPPPVPVDLDDLLDCALLGDHPMEDVDSDAVASDATHTRNLKNLTRWNRVPIGTFRQLRTSGGSFDGGVAIIGSPRVADGFSYGSTTSTNLGSPYARSSVFWEASTVSPIKERERSVDGSSAGFTRTRSGKRKVLISPVIFPIKEEPHSPVLGYRAAEDAGAGVPSKKQKLTRGESVGDLFDPSYPSSSSAGGLLVPPPLSLDA